MNRYLRLRLVAALSCLGLVLLGCGAVGESVSEAVAEELVEEIVESATEASEAGTGTQPVGDFPPTPESIESGQEYTFGVDQSATIQVDLAPGTVSVLDLTGAEENSTAVIVNGGGFSVGAEPGATESSQPLILASEYSSGPISLSVSGRAGELLTLSVSSEPQGEFVDGGDAPAIITNAAPIVDGLGVGVLGGSDTEDVWFVNAAPGDILALTLESAPENLGGLTAAFEFNGERRANVSAAPGGQESAAVILNAEEGGDWFVRVSGIGNYSFEVVAENQNDGGSGTDAGGELAAATPVSAGTINGQIGDNDTADFYSIDIPAAATVSMTITNAADSSRTVNARLLVNGREELRVGAAAGGSEQDSTVLTNEAGGAVIEFWGASSYELVIDVGAQNDGGSGADASGETSTPLEVDFAAPVLGQLGGVDSEDNFVFEADGPGTITMSTPDASAAFSFQLAGPDGRIGRTTALPGSPGSIEYDVEPGSRVTIEIWNADGNYELVQE